MINSFLQKLSTRVTAKANISTGIDFMSPTTVTFLRTITTCSPFTPDCGCDNSTIILIGDVYCPNTKCSCKLCLHKELFNLSAEAIINVRNARPCATCAILLLNIKRSPFLSVGQGLNNFEETPKSIQVNMGDVYCPGKYCSNREKCESLDG